MRAGVICLMLTFVSFTISCFILYIVELSVFAATLRMVNFKHGTRDGKHDDITSRNEM